MTRLIEARDCYGEKCGVLQRGGPTAIVERRQIFYSCVLLLRRGCPYCPVNRETCEVCSIVASERSSYCNIYPSFPLPMPLFLVCCLKNIIKSLRFNFLFKFFFTFDLKKIIVVCPNNIKVKYMVSFVF